MAGRNSFIGNQESLGIVYQPLINFLSLLLLASILMNASCRREGHHPASKVDSNDGISDSLPSTEEHASNKTQLQANLPAPNQSQALQLEPGSVRSVPVAPAQRKIEIETARVDPKLDGWDVESFNEQSLAQLKKLASWFKQGSPAEQFPHQLFQDPTFATSLQPPSESGTKSAVNEWIIQRWSSEMAGGAEDFSPQASNRKQLENLLRQLLPTHENVDAELKIIGIVNSDTKLKSRVRVRISGRDSTSRFQQNAVWNCTWVDQHSNQPKITAIELDSFEQIQSNISQPLFSDRTNAVLNSTESFSQQLRFGLDHWRDRVDWRFGWRVVGAHGLAIADVNGDGIEDLYYAETGGLPNRLFAQQMDGTLRDISKGSGIDLIEPTHGVLLIDLDNDGDQDLVAAVARFVLVYENDGNAKFTRHPALQSSSMIRSLAAADFNNDRLLDIYVCGYSPWDRDSIGLGRPLPYHDANNGAASYLLRNEGNFLFKDVTAEVGMEMNNRRFSYAAAWEDYDNDGDLDLYVANDFGRNNLYRNDHGSFTDVAAAAGVEDVAAGMSVSWGDYNRDGLADLYVGNMFSSAGNRIAYQRQFNPNLDEATRQQFQRHARGNSFFENQGDGTFRDMSQTAAVTEARWAWSSNFADINNDGWQDLVVANGMVTGTEPTGDL